MMNAIIRWLACLPLVLLGKLAGVESAIASMLEPQKTAVGIVGSIT